VEYLAPTGIRSLTVQPVAICYIDSAIVALKIIIIIIIIIIIMYRDV